MKIVAEVNGQTPKNWPPRFISDVVKKTIARARYSCLQKKDINLSIAFVSASQIKKLNRIYRRKNQVTDVLSFANYRDLAKLKKERERSVFLGDILIYLEYAKKSAKIINIPLEKEIAFVISHGVLHLLGFRHGKEMFELQDVISGYKK